jgi:hypothetical protein
MITYTKTLRYGKGYTGKSGNKCWIARINGTDRWYGLSRDFLEPAKIEREHFNRPRTMIDMTWELEPGLYEASQDGDRWFLLVVPKNDGSITAFQPTEERMKKILALMDDGIDFNSARKATLAPKPQVPAEVVA